MDDLRAAEQRLTEVVAAALWAQKNIVAEKHQQTLLLLNYPQHPPPCQFLARFHV